MKSVVRRRMRQTENRQDIGEKEAGDAGKGRQSNREMTEDETRIAGLQEMEKQKDTKLTGGEEGRPVKWWEREGGMGRCWEEGKK